MKKLLWVIALLLSMSLSAFAADVVESDTLIKAGSLGLVGAPRKMIVPMDSAKKVLLYGEAYGAYIRKIIPRGSTNKIDSLVDSISVGDLDLDHAHMSYRNDTVYFFSRHSAATTRAVFARFRVNGLSSPPGAMAFVDSIGWDTTIESSALISIGGPVGSTSQVLWGVRGGSGGSGAENTMYRLSTDRGSSFTSSGDVFAYNVETRFTLQSYPNCDTAFLINWIRQGITPKRYDFFKWNGTSWSSRIQIAPDTYNKWERGFGADVDLNGTIHLVWSDTVLANPHILHAYMKRNQGSFTVDTVATSPFSNTTSQYPNTAIDVSMYSGAVRVFYMEKESTSDFDFLLKCKKWDDNTNTWGSALTVSSVDSVWTVAGSQYIPASHGDRAYIAYLERNETGGSHGLRFAVVVDSTATPFVSRRDIRVLDNVKTLNNVHVKSN